MAVFAELNRECRLAGVIGMSGVFLGQCKYPVVKICGKTVKFAG